MVDSPSGVTPHVQRAEVAVEITVVHAPGCHFCDDAEQTLGVLATQFPLTIEMVALESPAGLSLTAHHRPAMNPLVLVDGRFFSSGRLPRKKLTALLERTASTHNPAGVAAAPMAG